MSQSIEKICPPEFETLLLANAPFIDLRAPIEYAAGSIPGAVNLPLLSDEERHQVGLTYRKQGQAAAIALGHSLVSGEIRQARLQKWVGQIQRRPETVLFCFRGGLRSQIVQQWLGDIGIQRPIVAGGYKALRRFVIEFFAHRVDALEFLVVGGPTGSGKTHYLHASDKPFIDLERLAVHRGSAFGAEESPQPNQVNFENALAIDLLKVMRMPGPILIENESQMIGRCTVPPSVYSKLRTSKQFILEVPLEQRVENIYQDYVVNSSLGVHGNQSRFTQFQNSMMAISKKLGGVRTKEILEDLAASKAAFAAGEGLASNRVWIQKLLVWYYDPLYQKSADAAKLRLNATGPFLRPSL